MTAPASPDEALGLVARWARSLEPVPGTAVLLDAGADAVVLLVDAQWNGPEPKRFVRRLTGTRRWVFRFPRRDEVAGRMEIEARVLAFLAAQLPVAVPRVAVHGLMPDGATRFTGAVALPGEPLDPDVLASGRGGLLLSQLVGTLATLHAISPRAVVDAGLPDPGPDPAGTRLRRWLARGEAQVVPRLARDSDAQVLLARWRAVAAEVTLLPDRPAVVHGDLGPPHVLVQPDRGLLTGLLDWTDVGVGDPATDLADLTGAHPASTAVVLTAYADAVDDLAESDPDHGGARLDRDALTRRVALHVALGPLRAALRGLDTGDAEALAAGLGALAVQARDPSG